MTRPVVSLEPFTPASAMEVFFDLDSNDLLEAQVMRGNEAGGFDLLADWMFLGRQGAACFVATSDTVPVAVLAVVPGLVPGMGHVAMLARDHRTFRRALVMIARAIGAGLPAQARSMGLHRLEARSWSGHPTAAAILCATGFSLETEMTGFGHSGHIRLKQWVWLDDHTTSNTAQSRKENTQCVL